jgi:hypothetical protein
MGFLKALFGAKAKSLTERDNVGTRYETEERVNAFWTPFILSRPRFPFVFYDMPEKKDAMEAMLSLPPFAIASDSGKVISTEVLEFGVYPVSGRKDRWGFFLAGEQMKRPLFDAAIASCKKHNGTNPRVSDPPRAEEAGHAKASNANASSVKFEREEKVDLMAMMKARNIEIVDLSGGPKGPSFSTKRHYNAPNKAAALAFLRENPVNRPLYYLVVHTPEGVFGRDKDGIYEQPD